MILRSVSSDDKHLNDLLSRLKDRKTHSSKTSKKESKPQASEQDQKSIKSDMNVPVILFLTASQMSLLNN